MNFLNKWAEQVDLFMEFVLVALGAGVLIACFSAKVRVRYLVGSIVFGCFCGAAASAAFSNPAFPIIAAILGTVTAPATIAKLSGMTLWQAVDEIRSRVDKDKNNDR